jgi:hypothetical protein
LAQLYFWDKFFWGNFWRFFSNSVNSTNFAIFFWKFTNISISRNWKKNSIACLVCIPFDPFFII